MIKLFKQAGQKTVSKLATDFAQDMANSFVSTASSFIGQRIVISGNSDIRKAEKILKRLNPEIFLRHAELDSSSGGFGSGDIRYRLKNITFFIPLPEYTYIYVDNTRCDLILFIFGLEYNKASALFQKAFQQNQNIALKNSVSKNRVYISPATFDSRGIIESGVYNRISAKTMDDIFTSEENKQQVVSYIDHWKKAKDLFNHLNIAHKLGILLYGPPGTGKSSMAKAIAHQLEYTIFTINVSSFPETVPDISPLLDEVDEDGCIILLEDIDYIFAQSSVERSAAEAARANALLQMLDGVNSSSNVVFIATTNSIESLNSALIRDGRFDLKVCMDNIEQDEAIAMCKSMKLSNDQIEEILDHESFPINPAALQNKCIKYIFSHMDSWNVNDDSNDDSSNNVFAQFII